MMDCYYFPGTRVEDAKAILAASPLRMFASDDLDTAATMVRFIFKKYISSSSECCIIIHSLASCPTKGCDCII